MRFLMALVVPAVLSLNLIACSSESEEPASPGVVQNPLVQTGGECSQDSDCASNRCAIPESSSIGIRGLPAPAPEGEPLPGDDDDDDDDNSNKPAPNPTPKDDPRGRPDPAPAPNPGPQPTPDPAPAPATTGFCVAR